MTSAPVVTFVTPSAPYQRVHLQTGRQLKVPHSE